MDESVVILGAGVSGLALARSLGGDCVVFEKECCPGGLCRSDSVDGFTFDRAGHVLHFPDSSVGDRIAGMLGIALLRRRRSAWVHTGGRYTEYPFQAHTYALPAEVARECVEGMREARLVPDAPRDNFRDWILAEFGRGYARHFFLPYNEKFWVHPLEELGTDWVQRFIPVPSLEEATRGAAGKPARDFGYNSTFFYPETGGIGATVEALRSTVQNLRPEHEAVRIVTGDRRVEFANGVSCGYERLVSTLPLPALVGLLDDASGAVAQAAAALRHVSVHSLNFGIARPNVSDRHWVYFPDPGPVFHRAVFPVNFSPNVAPSGHSIVSVEISYTSGAALSQVEARDRALRDLVALGILAPDDEPVVEHHFDIRTAYSVPDRGRRDAVACIRDFLAARGISSIGRYGSWVQMSISDTIEQAGSMARHIAGAKK